MEKKQSRKKKSGKISWQVKQPSLGSVIWPVLALGVLALAIGAALSSSNLGAVHQTGSDKIGSLRISEVQTGNGYTLITESGETPDWIEIENAGNADINLHGVSMILDEQVNHMLVFPNITLKPGEQMLVHADGNEHISSDGVVHASFRLPGSGGRLSLFDMGNNVLDVVDIPEMDVDESYSRNGDEWEIITRPTPGERNGAQAVSAGVSVSADVIQLSEIMVVNPVYFPDENGEFCDYIELHNASDHSVSLEGYYLSDDAAKLNKWQFPAVEIPAEGYLAVHCSGYDRTNDPQHLHTRFKLSQDGESVYLSNPRGVTVAAVSLPVLESGQAYSFVDGEWTGALAPTPNLPNTMDSAAQLANAASAALGGQVYISEIMAAPENEAYDWVELYNPTNQSVDLSGWGLSDDIGQPRKWQFPDGTVIAPGSHLALFCTGSESVQTPGYISAPFALSATGGYSVCLATPEGEVVDFIHVGQQILGVSCGRSASGQTGYLAEATPLSANGSQCYWGMADQARYSVSGGLFTGGDRLQVELNAGEGCRIYYTLDCTDPSESSHLYDGTPISISSTTVLRTRVYKDGFMPSLVNTQSYLYDVNAASETPYVLSLVSDPDNLYSDRRGIMVKGPNAYPDFPYGAYGEGANFWMDWERDAHVELYTGSGEAAFSQGCGIKMHGRNTRAYELKSFKVIARARYGDADFSYPIFDDREYESYPSFILRYSGQDYKYSFMRDAVLTSLAADTEVMYMEAEECIMYLNGEYYSAMYIREHVNTSSICRVNGWEGQEDEIDLIKGANGVMQGSNDTYKALEDWLDAHDVTTQEAYNAITSVVDLENFLDYACLQIVIGTPDTVNVKRYQNLNAGADGRWRWVLYDVDRGMRDNIDTFKLLAQGTNARLFQACMKNPIIREQFLVRLNELMSTTLSSRNIVEKIKEQYVKIQPLMPDYLDEIDMTEREHKALVESFAKFVERRPKQVLNHCQDYLHLSDSQMKTYFADTIAEINAYAASKE